MNLVRLEQPLTPQHQNEPLTQNLIENNINNNTNPGNTNNEIESLTLNSHPWDIDRLPRKLELLVFGGSDLDTWIFRAERYFTLNRLLEAEKIKANGICSEGEAQAWLCFEKNIYNIHQLGIAQNSDA